MSGCWPKALRARPLKKSDELRGDELRSDELSRAAKGTYFACPLHHATHPMETLMEGSRAKTEEIDKLRDLIADLKVAMLTTLDHDGSFRSRPLQTLELDAHNALWFSFRRRRPRSPKLPAGTGK